MDADLITLAVAAAVVAFVVLAAMVLAWRVGRLSARAQAPAPVCSTAAAPPRGPVVIAPVLVVQRRP